MPETTQPVENSAPEKKETYVVSHKLLQSILDVLVELPFKAVHEQISQLMQLEPRKAKKQ